jgi:hypothetical protein
MSPTLHAIVLLATIGGAIFACVRMRGSPRWGIGLVTACACLLLTFLLPGHLCDAGHPFHHLGIGSAGVVAVSIFVKDLRKAAVISLVIFITIATLAWNYLHLVHEPGVTGNPQPHEEKRRKKAETSAQLMLAEMGASDEKTYAASWLYETDFVRNADPRSQLMDIPRLLTRVEVRWLWHSWLTGLYECRRTPGALWFPGGKLVEASGRVEWRERDLK